MQEPHQAQMLQTGNGVNEFRDPGTRKKRPSVNPAAQFFKAWRLRRGSSEEPFDDPVVGLLSAWQARQFSSDRYAGGRRAKALTAFLFLDQISASISSYRFRAARRRRGQRKAPRYVGEAKFRQERMPLSRAHISSIRWHGLAVSRLPQLAVCTLLNRCFGAATRLVAPSLRGIVTVIEGSIQAIYQRLLVEGLTQKAHGSSVHGTSSEPLFRKSRDENDGDALALGDESALQVKAGEARHL